MLLARARDRRARPVPRKRSRKTPWPLRATLAAPSREGSSTKTLRCRRASSTVRARDAALPTSSSGTSSSVAFPDPSSASPARAAMATTMPAFMSKTPGPEARSPSIRYGKIAQGSARPHRVEVSEDQDSSAAADTGGHGFAPVHTRMGLGGDAPFAEPIADPTCQRCDALGILRRALLRNGGFEILRQPFPTRVEAREPVARPHVRSSASPHSRRSHRPRAPGRTSAAPRGIPSRSGGGGRASAWASVARTPRAPRSTRPSEPRTSR